MTDPQHTAPPRAEQARTWRRYLRFFGPRAVADLDDELRFHIEMRVRDYMTRGMSEAEARAATVARLGNLALARGECVTIATRRQRRMTRSQILDAFIQDVRFAFRTLGRQRGWTAIAVLTLALGIGANSAMFSVVNRLLLNPLPYPEADRVVVIFQEPSQGNASGHTVMVTPMGRLVAAWRANARSFESLEPYRTTDVTLQRAAGSPRVAHSAAVLPTFARFTGQRPLIGRMFSPAEAAGQGSVALLSEGMWRSEFGGERGLVGTAVRINDKPVTIIGVMPAEFQLPERGQSGVDIWLPLDLVRADDDGLLTVGRLRRGVARSDAATELDAITTRDPAGASSAQYKSVLAGPADLLGFQDSLILLAVAVALVLLIACANVAHLLLARASARQREMAIRTALGAGTERLFRQLVTESLMLSVAGCVGGLAIGAASLRLLISARPDSLAELSVARMDWQTFLVAATLSVITGIAFGVIGAVQASRHSNHDMLKAGSLTSSLGRSHGRLRGLLVVTEMALCTTLLVGAALLFRSVSHLQTKDAGFDAQGLYALNVQLPDERYASKAAKLAFVSELKTRARRMPGVQGLTIAASAPPNVALLIGSLQLEGEPSPPAGQTAFINFNGVEPDFFTLMRMRLVEGTTFTDTTTAAAQVIINEGMARKHWQGRSPIGRKLRVVYNGTGDWKTVVGVVADAYTQGLTSEASRPMLYTPGPGFFAPTLLVRTTGDASMIRNLSALAMRLDAKLPPPEVTSVADALRKGIAKPRFTMFLLMIFTLVAVGLAAVGLYGVLAYSVAQRTREIGIRIALGASRSVVAKSVMSHALMLAGIGGLIGLVGARWGVKLVGSMLYGVRQTDATSFVTGATILALVALLACLVPMRRALAVDPLIAMRAE
jgi:putative ABC transport system permease protein